MEMRAAEDLNLFTIRMPLFGMSKRSKVQDKKRKKNTLHEISCQDRGYFVYNKLDFILP